jgi:ABC-2 type transport system ATP-binding protein
LSAPLLSVSGLSKTYGSAAVLRDLTFDALEGEILAIVGANGAGKTTTFRLVAGLSRSSGGTMVLDGADISDHRVNRRSLGALIEGPATYGHLTAADNLRVLSWTAGHRISKTEIDRLLELVGLPRLARRKVGKFSTGMRQRLAIAIAILGSPKLLILDEPTSGLDAMGILEIRRLIRDLARSGLTILWSSHDLREVEDICSRLIWLHRGELRYCGDVGGLPRGTEVLEVMVSDAELANKILAEIGGACNLVTVPGGVRVGGVALGVVIERLTSAGIEVSDLKKITTNFEDVFAALAEESNGG